MKFAAVFFREQEQLLLAAGQWLYHHPVLVDKLVEEQLEKALSNVVLGKPPSLPYQVGTATWH